MNKIIKVLNEEHGKKVIEYLKGLGYNNTKNLKGSNMGTYHGLIKGIIDGSNSITSFDKPYEIIELPKDFTEQDLLNKFISFKYKSYHYEGLVVKEDDVFYILNNIKSNNNGHSDKSIYKYSLIFDSINILLEYCTDIKILDNNALLRYVEFLPDFDSKNTGRIFDTSKPIPDMKGWSKTWTWESLLNDVVQKEYFKPSTKEAFDAQNNSKSIKKWSVGSYVVFLTDYGGHPKGTVDKIILDINTNNVKVSLPFNGVSHCNLSKKDEAQFNGVSHCNLSKKDEAQWFATKSEAENFAKTLIAQDMFKKGDYIVILRDASKDSKYIKHNWCYIQSEDSERFSTSKDCINTNTNTSILYSTKDWRYATAEEITEYNRLNRPFNISKLSKIEEDLTGRYLKALVNGPQSTIFKKGDIVQIIKKEFINQYLLEDEWMYTIDDSTTNQWELLPKDYQIKDKNTPKYIKYLLESSGYKIQNLIYKVNSWKKRNIWVECNIDTDTYKAGTPLCMDALYDNPNQYVEATEEEYLKQVKPKEQTEFQFEIGKYYKFNIGKDKSSSMRIIRFVKGNETDRIYCDLWLMNVGEKFNKSGNSWNKKDVYNPIELSIEEIQQYLPDGHPDKIKSNDFKVGDYVVITKSNHAWNPKMNTEAGKIVQITDISDTSYINYKGKPCWSFGARNGHFRHATPEEINNHLISIGQIPDLIKQESEKYPFKPLKPGDLEWKIQVPQIKTHGIMWCEPAPMTKDNWKNKMILSIDDEELPMVSIIKTNSIKQLLNIE